MSTNPPLPRLTTESALPGMRVAYVPPEANHDLAHSSVEHGRINSVRKSVVFVRFDKQADQLGYYATTSQACRPVDLVEMKNDFPLPCFKCKTDKYLSFLGGPATQLRLHCSCCGDMAEICESMDAAGRAWNIRQLNSSRSA